MEWTNNMVEVIFKGAVNGVAICTRKEFSTGSRGFFANANLSGLDGKEYKCALNIVEVGSKTASRKIENKLKRLERQPRELKDTSAAERISENEKTHEEGFMGHYHRGKKYFFNNKFAEAIKEYNEAIKLVEEAFRWNSHDRQLSAYCKQFYHAKEDAEKNQAKTLQGENLQDEECSKIRPGIEERNFIKAYNSMMREWNSD